MTTPRQSRPRLRIGPSRGQASVGWGALFLVGSSNSLLWTKSPPVNPPLPALLRILPFLLSLFSLLHLAQPFPASPSSNAVELQSSFWVRETSVEICGIPDFQF